ncbi:MAG: hypothetical protein JSW61_09435 [Candidatus Thorarchaeota archaeon]|nr:MAG: hypothetical protein JSW61_09435 [Candidatus Thorarchaeota archaeon]
MSLTARDLLQKIAKDTGVSYQAIAQDVNEGMKQGIPLERCVQRVVEENGLDSDEYRLSPTKIAAEARRILREDYTQTLMISAVLGQLVEADGTERFPVPAFFAFLELLSGLEDAPRDIKSEASTEIEELTTRMIELTTTLVSLICRWSEGGIDGVAESCPTSLREIAKTVYRKTKMLQSGLWTCISCGKVVEAKDTHALMCSECDDGISEGRPLRTRRPIGTRDRSGYGQTSESE